MNVSLTPELEKMVNEKVISGLYASASEVVREGLRLLQERDQAKKIYLQELRGDIAAGAKEIKRGNYKEYSSGDELIEDIKKRNQRSNTRRKGKKA